MLHKGQCHCGKIAFTVEGDFTDAMECNCSICRMKGHLLGFVPYSAMTMETPEENISSYTFNTHKIQHSFCATCGVGPFGHASAPDGTKMAAINLRCLPDIDLDALTITKYDGKSL
jgi:hypothetical protein